jgi:hypothetical protein
MVIEGGTRACEGGRSCKLRSCYCRGPLSAAALSFSEFDVSYSTISLKRSLFLSRLLAIFLLLRHVCMLWIIDSVYLAMMWSCLTILIICYALFCMLNWKICLNFIFSLIMVYILYASTKCYWSRLSSCFYVPILSRNVVCLKTRLLFCSGLLPFYVSDGFGWLDANSPMLSYFAD